MAAGVSMSDQYIRSLEVMWQLWLPIRIALGFFRPRRRILGLDNFHPLVGDGPIKHFLRFEHELVERAVELRHGERAAGEVEVLAGHAVEVGAVTALAKLDDVVAALRAGAAASSTRLSSCTWPMRVQLSQPLRQIRSSAPSSPR